MMWLDLSRPYTSSASTEALTDSLPSSKKPLWVTWLPRSDAEDAADRAQRDHDSDDDVPKAVHHPTPPGEHLSS